jgi:UDP-glucuronate 4-epimerase
VKYLVTGAAGFIGSHLTQELVNLGHNVTPVDNFTNYYDPNLKEFRELHLIKPLGLSIRRLDLSSSKEVATLLNSEDFDSVIHLAAQPGVRVPLVEHERYINSNLNAFALLLSKVRERSIPNFVYASSSSVYGNNSDQNFSEKNSLPNPVSFYGATKLSNEVLARSGAHESSTRTRGLRLFTVYGAWGRPDMAYFRLVSSLLTNYKFTMFGNGSVRRDFTYIGDVLGAIYKLDKQLSSEKRGFSDVVNIGGGKPHSLDDMVNSIEGILGRKIITTSGVRNPNDVFQTNADPTYLRTLINFEPRTSLIEGLTSVINWAQSDGVTQNLKKWSESVS